MGSVLSLANTYTSLNECSHLDVMSTELEGKCYLAAERFHVASLRKGLHMTPTYRGRLNIVISSFVCVCVCFPNCSIQDLSLSLCCPFTIPIVIQLSHTVIYISCSYHHHVQLIPSVSASTREAKFFCVCVCTHICTCACMCVCVCVCLCARCVFSSPVITLPARS